MSSSDRNSESISSHETDHTTATHSDLYRCPATKQEEPFTNQYFLPISRTSHLATLTEGSEQVRQMQVMLRDLRRSLKMSSSGLDLIEFVDSLLRLLLDWYSILISDGVLTFD